MTLTCRVLVHPDFAGGVGRSRVDVQGGARAQEFDQHFTMTFGKLPGVRPVETREGLLVEGNHPTAVGRGNDPDIICHTRQLCNR
jgi:hypothetical protein